MKGDVNKKMRRGTTIIILLIMILSIGCIEQIGLGGPKEETCEDKAEKLVPEPFELKFAGESGYEIIKEQKWNDGIEMKCPFCYYKLGKEAEQKVYYHLTSNNNEPLKYSKQITAEDGTNLGTRSFTTKPVLKPIIGSERNVLDKRGWREERKKFEIIEYNIAECNWVTEQY